MLACRPDLGGGLAAGHIESRHGQLLAPRMVFGHSGQENLLSESEREKLICINSKRISPTYSKIDRN